MQHIALIVSLLVAILTAIFLSLAPVLSAERRKADQEKARERRLYDARMNARLLRLNL